MEALRLVSIYIFNGMSRLAHRRRSLPGRPLQIPYPLAYRQMTSQNFGPSNMSAADVPAAISSLDTASGDRPSAADNPPKATLEKAAAGDSDERKPDTATPPSALKTAPTVFNAPPEAAAELLHNEFQLKRFIDQLEEKTLILLEPTEEGVKVPRPVPFPKYLTKAPEIPISQTYTTVLRRLHNQKRAVYLKPEFPTAIRKFPKKPRVPPYLLADIVEQRQKTEKVLLKLQDIYEDKPVTAKEH